MAARRNKSQARRKSGNNTSHGLPGWAWLVLGILLTLIVVLVAPAWLKSDGDGFFRPQPNPDAQPVPVSTADDEIAPQDESTTPGNADDSGKKDDFAFYDMLTGKEVPMTDAELAATARAETRRAEAERKAAQERERERALRALAGQTPEPATGALPAPIEPAAATPPTQATASTAAARLVATTASTETPSGNTGSSTAASTGGDSRYLLQAGAFRASGQAEELKARIAMLGLSARVEPAQIKDSTVYRVRMGPYGTASALSDAKRKLESGGLQALAIRAR